MPAFTVHATPSRLRRRLIGWTVAALPIGSFGQASVPLHDPRIAAPFVTPSQFVRSALEQHFVPAAEAFARSTAALAEQLGAGCADDGRQDAARAGWRAAMLDWERLSAVAVGPLLERRSARSVDFWPARPVMVRAAIEAQPTTALDLERIGAPAKGLPALEWLLWQGRVDARHCAYARLLADDCAREARAILAGFQALSQRAWDDESALPVLHEWVGQVVGGLEQLRWKKIGKPARSGRRDDWPRGFSGSTRAAWQAHAEGLRRMLLGPGGGGIALGSLDALLRGRGHLALAAELERAALQAGRAVAAADPARAPTVAAAQQALARTKAVVEDKAAGALQITVGFSDADGD